jgi:hypothetical protein
MSETHCHVSLKRGEGISYYDPMLRNEKKNRECRWWGFYPLFMDAYLGLKLKKRKREIIAIIITKFLHSCLLT